MSSAVLDTERAEHSTVDVTELLVLWQHPLTRQIVPIGRFSYEDRQYGFTYTRAARGVEGFRPLPGLPNLERAYRSSRMPAVFDQRVMSSERPDYSGYLSSLGLSQFATPWEQIVESGGARAGDTLQFMSLPRLIAGRAVARFLANGVRHVAAGYTARFPDRTVRVDREQQERELSRLQLGSTLRLEPELDNAVDENAILLTSRGVPVGWVPRVLSASIRVLIAAGVSKVSVHRIADASVSPHLRLVLDLDASAPEGFEFDPDNDWAPLTLSS